MPRYGVYTDVSAASANLETRLTALTNQSTPVYNVKAAAYGAVGNGVTDDRAAIQLAIDAAIAAGGGTVYFPAGTYALTTYASGYTDRILRVHNAGSAMAVALMFAPGAVLTTALVTNTSGVESYMLYLTGNLEDCLIEGGDFRHTHGVTAGRTITMNAAGGATSTVKRLTIRRNVFRNFSRSIQIQGVEGFTIDGNRFLYTSGRDSGNTVLADPNVSIWVQVEAGFASSDGIVVNNYFDGCTSGDVSANTNKSALDGMVYGRCRGWVVANNTIRRAAYEGIYVSSRQSIDGTTSYYPCTITGNIVDTSLPTGANVDSPYGIRCDEHHAAITGNTVRNAMRGIWVSGAALSVPVLGPVITGNKIHMLDGATGNSFQGIYLSTTTDALVANNSVFWNTATTSGTDLQGIMLSAVQRVAVRGNMVRAATNPAGKTLNGYWFEGGTTTDITLDDNTADNCDNGLWASASASTFAGCRIGQFHIPRTTTRMAANGTAGFFRRSAVDGGASLNRGDGNATLVVGTDYPVQRFTSALTANRTVTLSTTGAMEGDAFRVIRTGLGAFTLDVGGLKTIPSATAAFVDVVYANGGWTLAGYGAL